jgi:predicted DNA-binding protein
MKRTTIWLPVELEKALKTVSAKTGAPVAELIRRAIKAYTKSTKKEGR